MLVCRRRLGLQQLDLQVALLKMRRFPPRVAFSQPLSSLPHRQSLRPPPLPVRYASTSQSATRRFFSTALLIGGTVALVTYYYDSRSLLHEHVVMPVARLFDPETGHRLAVRLLSGPRWLRPWDRGVDGPELKAEVRLAVVTKSKRGYKDTFWLF